LRVRGLDGVRLCISDAHVGLKHAIAQVLGCRWQRCTVHFLRDMLGHVSRAQQPLVSGAIRGIFTAASAAEARARLGQVVDRLQALAPKVAGLLEAAESELLAFYACPAEHWSKLRSTDESFKTPVALSAGWDGVSLLGGRGRPRSEEQGRGAGSPAAQPAP
jgi:putative transposase